MSEHLTFPWGELQMPSNRVGMPKWDLPPIFRIIDAPRKDHGNPVQFATWLLRMNQQGKQQVTKYEYQEAGRQSDQQYSFEAESLFERVPRIYKFEVALK